MRPADPAVVGDLERILSPNRVLSRPIDRLGRSADASIYRLIPEAIVRPRSIGEIRDLLAWATPPRPAPDVPGRGHVALRTGGERRRPRRDRPVLPRGAGAGRRGAGVDAAGGDRRPPEPSPRRPPHPHRARPGLDRRGHGRRHPRQQLLRDVLRRRAEQLPHARLAPRPARRRRRGRHRAARRRRGSSGGRGPRSTPSFSPCATRSAATSPSPPRIRHKFSTKNTSGYSLNAFVDFDRPADILAHLMVGSEGTLGFVGETTFRTVPEPPARATALVYFADLEEAGASVAPLAAAGADALEILDAASLRSVSAEHPLPFEIERRHAALLVEFRRMDEAALAAATGDAQAILKRLPSPRAPAVHDRRGGAGGAVARAQGPRRAHRSHAPDRDRLPDRGRGGARRSARRGHPRLPGALRAPRSARHRHLRAREGREPALRDGRGRAQPRGGRALRCFHPGARGPRREQVRRGDQGRARRGPQHGPLREDRVGRSRVRRRWSASSACSTPQGS